MFCDERRPWCAKEPADFLAEHLLEPSRDNYTALLRSPLLVTPMQHLDSQTSQCTLYLPRRIHHPIPASSPMKVDLPIVKGKSKATMTPDRPKSTAHPKSPQDSPQPPDFPYSHPHSCAFRPLQLLIYVAAGGVILDISSTSVLFFLLSTATRGLSPSSSDCCGLCCSVFVLQSHWVQRPCTVHIGRTQICIIIRMDRYAIIGLLFCPHLIAIYPSPSCKKISVQACTFFCMVDGISMIFFCERRKRGQFFENVMILETRLFSLSHQEIGEVRTTSNRQNITIYTTLQHST
jgi:hypothetical protein